MKIRLMDTFNHQNLRASLPKLGCHGNAVHCGHMLFDFGSSVKFVAFC